MRKYSDRFLILSSLLVTVMFAGCGHKSAPKAATTPASSEAVQVETSPVKTGTIQDTASVTGTLTALNDSQVGTKAAGLLVAVYKREGDRVTKGEVVAQQDTADLENQLQEQQALVAQQEANTSSAEAKVQQAETTWQNAVTTLQITKSQTASAVAQAKSTLNSAEQSLQVTVEGARVQQRKEALAQVASAKATLNNAASNLKRYEELYRENAVSAQDLDTNQTAFDTANANYNNALQAYDLLQAGPRPQEIQQAKDQVQTAHQQLLTAEANTSQVAMEQENVRSAFQGIGAAKAAYLQAKAAVAQAIATRNYAAQQVQDCSIVSPFNGVVSQRLAQPGEQMGAGKPVLEIVSLRDIYFDAQLPETQFSEIHVGLPVQVSVDAFPGTILTGKITHIFPVASSTAASFTVRVSLPNDARQLRPQMFARGTIILATHTNVLIVPRQAVVNLLQNKGQVFVVKDGVAHAVDVKFGIMNANEYQALTGLSVGDKLVTLGAGELQDGMKVQDIPANS